MNEIIKNNRKIQKTVDFALGGFSRTMDLNEVKIHALALMQIGKDEDPTINREYPINLEDFAAFAGLTDKYTLKKNIVNMARAIMKKNPNFTIRGENETVISTIFQEIRIPDDGFYVYVTYAPRFRKAVILMKSKYDIIYPLETILKFRHKYTPFLYNFLLAKICEQREVHRKTTGRYIIEATIEEMCKTISFQANFNFNSRFQKYVIEPSCEDLNEHSELIIENNLPTPIKQGRKIIGYRFSILMNVSPEAPLLFSQEKISASSSDIPNESYIYRQLQDLGVSLNFIKFVAKEGDIRKIWQTLVYTRLKCNDKPDIERGKYFNTAYTHNYASSKPLETMFIQMYESFPEYQDDITLAIYKYYLRNLTSPTLFRIMDVDPVKLTDQEIKQKLTDCVKRLKS